MRINVQREQALKLRLNGKSYSEIERLLGIPKSTLSDWLSNVLLSEKVRKELSDRTQKNSIEALIKRNKQQTTLARSRAKIENQKGRSQISNLSKQDVFLIGIALYWAEGHKRLLMREGREVTYHPISLTNADPALIKMFIRFLEECLGVPREKMKAHLRIFPHQNETTLISFWQRETHIPIENFTKIYTGISKSSLGKRPYQRLPHGVIQIRVADTRLFHNLIGNIEGLQKFV